MLTLKINGQSYVTDIAEDTPLLWYLRDHLGITGTKFGCGAGQCGACTVHVDGDAARACLLPLGGLVGRRVTTIEGLSADGGHPVQQAWQRLDVPQCGYCQAGQIMSAAAFLAKQPHPSREQIHAAMAGNLCRCGTYPRIEAAILAASRALLKNE